MRETRESKKERMRNRKIPEQQSAWRIKGHSADKLGTNMFLIVSPAQRQTLERLPGQNHRRAQMSEIFMFTKTHNVQDG